MNDHTMKALKARAAAMFAIAHNGATPHDLVMSVGNYGVFAATRGEYVSAYAGVNGEVGIHHGARPLIVLNGWPSVAKICDENPLTGAGEVAP